MSQNLSSAAVVIGALRFKGLDKQTKKIGKIVKNIFLGINFNIMFCVLKRIVSLRWFS